MWSKINPFVFGVIFICKFPHVGCPEFVVLRAVNKQYKVMRCCLQHNHLFYWAHDRRAGGGARDMRYGNFRQWQRDLPIGKGRALLTACDINSLRKNFPYCWLQKSQFIAWTCASICSSVLLICSPPPYFPLVALSSFATFPPKLMIYWLYLSQITFRGHSTNLSIVSKKPLRLAMTFIGNGILSLTALLVEVIGKRFN